MARIQKQPAGPVYDIRDRSAREYGAIPSLWMVLEKADDGFVFAKSLPRGVVRILPVRHFVPENVVADVEAALAEWRAKGGQP